MARNPKAVIIAKSYTNKEEQKMLNNIKFTNTTKIKTINFNIINNNKTT